MTTPPAPQRLVGAHSIGTANLVSIANEATRPDWWDTQLADITGQLRDRPVFRAKRPEGNWMDLDFASRYGQLKAAGFDLIYLDLLSAAPHPADQQSALRGAAMVGIEVVLMPDTDGWNGSINDTTFPTEAQKVTEAARRLTVLAPFPATYHDEQGRLVVAPYNAEVWTPARWLAILVQLEANLGYGCVLEPDFQNTTPMASFHTTLGARMVGCGIWGGRSPNTVTSGAAQAASARALGLYWTQFTAVQDTRPREALFDEAGNSGTLRGTWFEAITGNALRTMHTTVDDYFENSFLEPTQIGGDGWLWLSSFYVSQFKNQAEPTILRDALFLSNRLHPHAAVPTSETYVDVSGVHKGLMVERGGDEAAVDNVEVVAMLTAAATVNLDGTNFTGVAGVNVFTVPLTARTHTATVTRASQIVASVSSAQPSVATLPIQDLNYMCASNVHDASWHTPADAPAVIVVSNPTTPTDPDPALVAEIATLQAELLSAEASLTTATAQLDTETATATTLQATVTLLQAKIARAQSDLA